MENTNKYIKENINILYEDNHVLIAIKPENILSQGDITGDNNMVDILKTYLKIKYKKPGNIYLGLIHRLDRPVSGLMLFAKTSKAAGRLSKDFQNLKISKKYLAILEGKLEGSKKKEYILENLVFKDSQLNQSFVYDDKENKDKKNKDKKQIKKAILKYKILGYNEKQNKTLVDVELITGRHHQIRVQFSNLNHPVLNDRKYGTRQTKNNKNISLFAYYLKFNHPVKKVSENEEEKNLIEDKNEKENKESKENKIKQNKELIFSITPEETKLKGFGEFKNIIDNHVENIKKYNNKN